jgi:ubiquinone/menaquinone biosynthesis C-methylase UbiE
VSARASSFGRRAADYERSRPDYGPELAELAAARLGLGADARVIDLGAGTGKLTRVLARHFAEVTAVEPDASMRAASILATQCCKVLEGTAEAIPLPDGSADAVFCGESFHWFATRAALDEIARVLRPHGGLVLVWRDWWKTDPPLPEKARELLKQIFERPDLERHAGENDAWKDCFEGSPFEQPREEQLAPEVLELDADRLVTLILSTSVFGSLPEAELEPVEGELRRLITGEYGLPIETQLWWTRLRG